MIRPTDEWSDDGMIFGFMALLFLVFAGAGALIASYDVTVLSVLVSAAFGYAGWRCGRRGRG